ncbi:MAG: hypothetical protein IKT46_06335 [Clostridia bacterium]|nr:hypothetical protein [Clostridia bacterium]
MKRIISLILCLTMLYGCMSFAVLADEVEAVIGTTEYQTLEEALDAARNGDVIQIKKDVAVEDTVKVNKTLTLRTDVGATVKGSFNITGSLTLFGVGIEGTDPVSVSGGSFTMHSGSSVTGGVDVKSGVFNFYGGSINAPGEVNIKDDSSTFRMKGDASLKDGVSVNLALGSCVEITGELTGNGSIGIKLPTISSGDLVAVLSSGVSLPAAALARFKVSSADTQYTVILNGNYVIADRPVGEVNVARIGDEGYPTLKQAFDAAGEAGGATVTLTSVAMVDAPITVKGNVTLATDGNYSVYAGTSLDGSLFVISKGASLTLSDPDNTLTVSGRDNGSALFDVQGTLKMDKSVTLTGNVNTSEKHNKGAVYINGGSFVMSGGSISGNKSKSGTVYIVSGSFTMTGGAINNNTAATAGGVYIAGGSFTLGGGSIYANSGDSVYNCGSFTLSGKGAIYSSATYPATIFLSGSSVIKVAEGWNPGKASAGYTNVIPVAKNDPKLLDVIAEFEGTASADNFKMSEKYESKFTLKVKDKKLIVAAADDVFTVYWGNNPYMTIEEAVAALPENSQATLKIVGDTTVNKTVVIKKGMNITVTTDVNPAKTDDEYKTRTIKRAADFMGEIFRVEKGATLVIEAPAEKSIVLDGEGKKVTNAMIHTAGGTVIGKGATLKANNNKNAEKLTGTTPVYTYGGGIYVEKEGSCTINGGIISGNYASYGAGVYVNDGALALTEGEIKENSALYGAGVYLETTGTDKKISATFAMAGGSLTGNKATAAASVKESGVAGGVFITNGSAFTMSGGKIEKNTATLASGVCVGVAKYSKDMLAPKLVLSDKAEIATDNTVHLAIPNMSYVSVTADLTSKTATTLSLPEELPQNMKLVAFEYGDKATENEAAASKALAAKRFALDKTAKEYFNISISHSDKSVLVNTAGDYLPSRAKTGKHYNGLSIYEEDDKNQKEGELPTPIVYDPVVIRESGSFTVCYEMSYYPNLYKSINSYITAPFPEGTRIVMIDTSDEKNVGYYYYEVTGDETVIEVEAAEEEKKNTVKTPDIIEIPLINFYKMGTVDQFYTPVADSDNAKKAVASEKLLFVIDFTDIRKEKDVTYTGEFEMVWNHYYPGKAEGERYDISGNVMTARYKITESGTSTVSLDVTKENALHISYTLGSDSSALACGKGVALIQVGQGSFPRGTVIADGEGRQYIAAAQSGAIAVPLPTDADGKLLSVGELTLNVSNYYGTALRNINLRCVIAASDDGFHCSVAVPYDAESDGIKLSVDARDEYAILVTTTDGTKKPYYESYDDLKDIAALEMTVKGLANLSEVDTFNLSLLKRYDNDYISCDLSELFNVSSEYGSEVILNTGSLSLELNKDIESLIGSEYKIVFKVGNAVEYVKVNVTEKKK